MGAAKTGGDNYLDYFPRRIVEMESGMDPDTTRVSLPRFGRGVVGRFLSRLTGRGAIAVDLDRFGAYLIRRCDGRRSVYDIAIEMRETFGDQVEPVFERTAFFVKQLKRAGMVEVLPGEPHTR